MNKREDLNIFIMGYKPLDYGYWDNSLYTPIECGYAARDEHFNALSDDFEGSISKDNGFYLENTAIYYIWKNVHTPFKGQCQYRRRLEFDECYDFRQDFKNFDVITAKPLKLNIRSQYARCHLEADIDLVIEIIKEQYPDADVFFNRQNKLYYSNGFIMQEKLYDEYCEFLFYVLGEWLRRKGFKNAEDVRKYVENSPRGKRRDTIYQTEIGGFLSERIFSFFVWKKNLRVKEISYKKYEGVL